MKVSIVEDPKLPELNRAFDEKEMRGMLTAALQRNTQTRIGEISRVRHEVLKYKPGKHCVIKYRLEWEGNDSTSTCLIGKLYRNNRGEHLFRKFQNLWNASQDTQQQDNLFRMPFPIAYVSDLGMILQTEVSGLPLSSISPSEDWNGPVRSVGRNVAALHRLNVSTGEKKTMSDHIKKYCHPGPQVLIAECPDLAHLVEPILYGLETDTGLQNAPVYPVHGDLAPTQILILDDHAFFVDLDGFCLSHPVLDIANFMTALTVHLGARSEGLKKTFIGTYLQFHSPEMLTGLRTYQAFIYLRRAMIRFRLKATNDWRHQVRLLLKTGNEFLSTPTELDAPSYSSLAQVTW